MSDKKPSKFAVRLARKLSPLCPSKSWQEDAPAMIQAELDKERKEARKHIAKWARYIEELDGVE